MAKKGRVPTDDAAELRSNPFAGLEAIEQRVPRGEAVAHSERQEPEASGGNPYGGKIVVRREKKGRGGKAATVIEGLRADAARLEEVARLLRKELGCGARVEGATVVVQGAQTERVRAWLQREGAARVVIGN